MVTKEEINEFLDVVNRLCEFEGMQRHLRGRGVFTNEVLPIPNVVKVIKWLRSLDDSNLQKL